MGQSRRLAVGGVVVLIVVIVIIIAGLTSRGDDDRVAAGETPTKPAITTPTPTPMPTPTPTPTPTITPGAPSAEPTAAPTTETAAPSADANLTSVEVVVTYYGWDPATDSATVGAYVPRIETGATCTLTLRQGDAVQSVEAPATPDASSTSCGALSVAGLSPGSWTAAVTYTSATAAGTSTPVTIEVP